MLEIVWRCRFWNKFDFSPFLSFSNFCHCSPFRPFSYHIPNLFPTLNWTSIPNLSFFVIIIADLKISCFGDSNLKRHQDLLHYGILSESMFILTYTFDELKESLSEIGQVVMCRVPENLTRTRKKFQNPTRTPKKIQNPKNNFVNLLVAKIFFTPFVTNPTQTRAFFD